MKNIGKNVLRLGSVMLMMFGCIVAPPQSSSTVIHVVDGSDLGGLAGVVLLVTPGGTRGSQVVITDGHGTAVVSDMGCEICTVSAFDVGGLFSNVATEFSGRSASVVLMMPVRPVVDSVGDPQAVWVSLLVSNSNGERLVNQDVVFRPTVVTWDGNVRVGRTDSRGLVRAQFRAINYLTRPLIYLTI